MNKYYVTIGLEIHIELNTNTKMFSPSLCTHEGPVNTHINPIDLAMPGTLPSVNANAVKKAIRLANALHMQLHPHPITFDRKNYYYWDLPKGFQITQQFNPIGTNGYVVLNDGNETKIKIERIHMEEDTAKQLKVEGTNDVLLNYNRCGVPLIEIVSCPDMHSATEVEQYLHALHEICVFMDVSDAKMEEGSMRADVNISLSKDPNKLGTKVEIKNINSISNAAQAVEYEIKRQGLMLDQDLPVEQETRRFDDVSATTIFMRKKVDAVDYKYMTEANILAIDLPNQFIDDALKEITVHPYEVRKLLLANKLSDKDINILLSNKHLYDYFTKVYTLTNEYKDAARWVLNELLGAINKQEKTFNDVTDQEKQDLLTLIKDYKANKFNTKQAKDLFNDIFVNHLEYKTQLNKLLASSKSFSEQDLQKMINDLLSQHPETKQDLLTHYDKAEKFITGSLMKLTKGQANPVIIKQLLMKMK